MHGSGKDGHLPCHRLASPRSPHSSMVRRGSSPFSGSGRGRRGSTSSSRTGSSSSPRYSSSSRSGRRGSSSSSRTGSSSSSSYTLPSFRTDPSDNSWDSPGWHPRRFPPLSPTPVLFAEVDESPHSPYSSWWTSSSQKARRRAAAAAAAALKRRVDTMRYLSEQRHASLLFPPSPQSAEDYARIYSLGIPDAEYRSARVFCSAPDPYWCDEGYESSNDSEDSEDSPPPSPRFVKSEGGVSPLEPGFSMPFVISNPERSINMKAHKKKTKAIDGRNLFPEDGDLDEVIHSGKEREAQLSSQFTSEEQGLLDPTCETVADLINGKTPEEIRKTFNIKNDFTTEEEEEIRGCQLMNMKGLLDLTSDVADMIKGKTPEEIRKTFNIKNDFTGHSSD